MLLHFRRGVAIAGPSVTDAGPPRTPSIARWAVDGRDHLGLRPAFAVDQGDAVEPGQILLRDRNQPGVIVRSPAAGRVAEIQRRHPATGAFRLTLNVDAIAPFPCEAVAAQMARDRVRDAILGSGLWPALRQRPYGLIADPSRPPHAILVCATAADPHAPDPHAIIAAAKDDFDAGVRALRTLADGPVHVTQRPGPHIAEAAIIVDGPYPAGLPGPQIHALRLLAKDRIVWWLNYQETIAIGRVVNAGMVEQLRTIAVAAPDHDRSASVRALPGAAIEDLADLTGGIARSGPRIGGRTDEFLGRHHLQISVSTPPAPWPAWLHGFHALLNGGAATQRPIVPLAAHRRFPFDIPVVPLLRALAIGDVETAQRLGCLDLIEEDVALLSHLCPSRNDYGALLRRSLDEIRRSA